MDKIEQNKEIMKKFEVMINTNDLVLAQELMRTGFSDVQWKLEEMVASEDKVAVRWTLTGTHDGEFLGVLPTGNKISVCVMNFYYFDGSGKIVNDVAAEGMIGILRGIGAIK